MDNESPEVIEQKMEETRESLSEKVSLLEQQVVGTIHSANEAVQDTVETVKSAVADTLATVRGGVQSSVAEVKEVLDMSKHVREHPLPMLGGAVFAGMITGWVLFPRRAASSHTTATAFVPMASQAAAAAPRPRPAWLNDLYEIGGRELKKLAEHAIARASSSVQKGVEEGIPKLIDRAMPEVPANYHRENGAVFRS